jgi:hypothetical protein
MINIRRVSERLGRELVCSLRSMLLDRVVVRKEKRLCDE